MLPKPYRPDGTRDPRRRLVITYVYDHMSIVRLGKRVTNSYAGDYPGNGRHRRSRRRRPSGLMLLDPPSVTGLPPWQISGIAEPRIRGRWLMAITAAVAVMLVAATGIAVALRSTRGHAPFPHFTLTAPFPSVTATASPHGTTPAQNSMTPPSAMPTMTAPVTPSPTMTTTPAMVTASATPTATASPGTATVTVSYIAVSTWYNGLEGEVRVTNTGSSAIAGWQIVVGLPYDHFTAVSENASGYVSNHILVMNPASSADSVPAGGSLTVLFTAYGTQTTPELCAFNNISCQ